MTKYVLNISLYTYNIDVLFVICTHIYKQSIVFNAKIKADKGIPGILISIIHIQKLYFIKCILLEIKLKKVTLFSFSIFMYNDKTQILGTYPI